MFQHYITHKVKVNKKKNHYFPPTLCSLTRVGMLLVVFLFFLLIFNMQRACRLFQHLFPHYASQTFKMTITDSKYNMISVFLKTLLLTHIFHLWHISIHSQRQISLASNFLARKLPSIHCHMHGLVLLSIWTIFSLFL